MLNSISDNLTHTDLSENPAADMHTCIAGRVDSEDVLLIIVLTCNECRIKRMDPGKKPAMTNYFWSALYM